MRSARGPTERTILAVVALAEHLRLTTLADGVDTADEHAFVAQIGFNAVQGRAVAPLLDAGGTDAFLIEYDQSLPAPFDIRRRGGGGWSMGPTLLMGGGVRKLTDRRIPVAGAVRFWGK